MTDHDTPQDAADEIREIGEEATKNAEAAATQYRATFESALPEGMRGMAEQAAAQSRETYEKAKDTLDETVRAWEKSFDAYGQAAAAFNHKLFEIAQANINAGFEFARQLSEVRDFGDLAKTQSAFFQQQLAAFADQAGELRALTGKVAEDATGPLKSQFSRNFEKFPRAV